MNKDKNEKNKFNRLLSILDISYFGLSLKYYMELIFGEVGQISGENPMQIKSLILTIKACTLVMFNNEKTSELSNLLNDYLDYVIPYILGEEKRPKGWKPANDMATEIETIIENLEYRLVGNELASFSIGKILGKWSMFEANTAFEKINEDFQQKLLYNVKLLNNNTKTINQITEIIKNYRKSDSVSVIHTPHEIYNVVRYLIKNMTISENITIENKK